MNDKSSNKPLRLVLIGGSRTLIRMRPEGQMVWGGFNPGSIAVAHGGTLYDLAAKLAAMGNEVSFAGVAGADFAGMAARRNLADAGVDVTGLILLPGRDSAAREEVLNLLDQPEMDFGNEDIFQAMTGEMVADLATPWKDADMIVAEGCFSLDVLERLPLLCPGVPILLVPEDPAQAAGLAETDLKPAGIILTRAGAEALWGKDVLSEAQLREAGQGLLGRGILRIFITLGPGGVYYIDREGEGIEGPGTADLSALILGTALGQPASACARASIGGGGDQ